MASRVGATIFKKSSCLHKIVKIKRLQKNKNMGKKSQVIRHFLPTRCCQVVSSIHSTISVRYAGSKARGQPKNKGVPGYRMGVTKGLDSHHTGSLAGSYWAADRLADDIMIRKFLEGVFYNQLSSDIVIKRKNNLINIVFLISELSDSDLTKFYFKVGFSERLLTELFSCIVSIDAQTSM